MKGWSIDDGQTEWVTGGRRRGQANLLAVAVALLAVTTAAGIGLALADAGFSDGQRDAESRQVAVSLADRLIAEDSTYTSSANVLNASAIDRLDATRLQENHPSAANRSFRIAVDGETVAEAGTPDDGTTVRRLVILEERQTAEIEPSLRSGTNHSVTLPRRTSTMTVDIDAGDATVKTVRTGDRVVLYDPDGLDGTYDVSVSRHETATVTFESSEPLETGDVRIVYYPDRTTKAELEVTVGA